jgi:peptidoglycan hydrolase-like protein with peptidoglycan-binding domain
MKKIDKRIWWSLPILLGGYLIYRQFAKSKQSVVEPTAEPIDQGGVIIKTKPTNPTYSSSYPLKNGSRDAGSPKNPQGLVVDLQKLINSLGGYTPKIGQYVSLPIKLTEDGIYGNNTEWAVQQYTGKKTVDSDADLDILREKMIEKNNKDYFKIPTF